MKRILEYEDFMDEEDLKELEKRERILRILDSSFLEKILNRASVHPVNSEGRHFTSASVRALIDEGALGIFSGLLPLDEEDEDKVIKRISEIEDFFLVEMEIDDRNFPYELYNFFVMVFYCGRGIDYKIRYPIKWEKIK